MVHSSLAFGMSLVVISSLSVRIQAFTSTKAAFRLSRRSVRCFGGSALRSRRRSSEGEQKSVLEWESFEFGESPKWDARFDSSRTIVAGNEDELNLVRQAEAIKDQETAATLNQQRSAWERLSPEIVESATQLLLPFIQEERVQRIKSVLNQRTGHTRLLFENPANPSNIWACLRTVDSFGIQHVDVVIQSGEYKGKAALSQKRGMRTAMGSAQWMTLRNHLSTADAVRTLKTQNNCRIFASDLNPNSRDIRTIDWSSYGDQPICIVMGNEERGISSEMRELADETFTLPMYGFAESFNLSVATAITLAHLSAASQGDQGPLRPGDLPEQEKKCLLLKGILNSYPKRKTAEAVLKQNGIKLPPEIQLL